MKLVYTDDALEDLIRLREFIAQWSPEAANRTGAELVARIENIRAFPYTGRPVAQAPDSNVVRDGLFGRYVVRYAVHADVVVVLRIWHSREDRGGER